MSLVRTSVSSPYWIAVSTCNRVAAILHTLLHSWQHDHHVHYMLGTKQAACCSNRPVLITDVKGCEADHAKIIYQLCYLQGSAT